MDTDPVWTTLRETLREDSRDRRANNRDRSAAILTDHGVAHTAHNGGWHLVVTHDGRTVDFWPSTGLFRERGTAHRRQQRGVYNLLRSLNVEVSNAQ